MIGFWKWLLTKDCDGFRGIGNIINRWLAFHLSVGIVAAFLIPSLAIEFASKTALPAASILVGFSFAWAGRSASLFQDKTFSRFLIENAPPIENYVYSFQLAILTCIIFVCFSFILLAGGIGIDLGEPRTNDIANKIALFSIGSLALRECWGVISFVNNLTLQFYAVRSVEIGKESGVGQ